MYGNVSPSLRVDPTCSGGEDDYLPEALTGMYVTTCCRSVELLIRINRRGRGYTVSQRRSGVWHGPTRIVPLDRSLLEDALGKPIDVPFIALGCAQIVIFKMPAGWQNGNFQTRTGYWFATLEGSAEIRRIGKFLRPQV